MGDNAEELGSSTGDTVVAVVVAVDTLRSKISCCSLQCSPLSFLMNQCFLISVGQMRRTRYSRNLI